LKRIGLKQSIVLLQSIIFIILVVIASGCAATDQNNPLTAPQNQNSTFAAPDPEREQINKFITPQEALTLIQQNQNNPYFVIIDDRAPGEFKSGHIAGAINIPFSNFTASVSRLDKNKIYLVYCASGCGAGSGRMESLGFKEVYDIQGGISAWKSEGLPIVE